MAISLSLQKQFFLYWVLFGYLFKLSEKQLVFTLISATVSISVALGIEKHIFFISL